MENYCLRYGICLLYTSIPALRALAHAEVTAIAEANVALRNMKHTRDREVTEMCIRDRLKKTGKHLGVFDSPEDATAYARQLHEDQESLYAPQQGPLFYNSCRQSSGCTIV